MIEIKITSKKNLFEKKSFSRKDVLLAIAEVIAEDADDGYVDEVVAEAFTIFGSKIVTKLFDESED